MLPRSDEIEDLVVRQLGSTALFAAHFRENAARALLLPRRFPGRRTPLWLQRRRSADLLSVAEPFRQASNSPDLGVEGTGLGLALVHKIVTRHGGCLCCKSAEGQGTTFSVFLPVEMDAFPWAPDFGEQ